MLLAFLFLFLQSNRKKIALLRTNLLYLQCLLEMKFRKIKKLRNKLHKLKLNSTPHCSRCHSHQLPCSRGPLNRTILDIDIFEKTGIFEDAFDWLYRQLNPVLLQPCTNIMHRYKHGSNSLEPRTRLLLVLQWYDDISLLFSFIFS